MKQDTTTRVRVLIYADFRSPHAKAWANGMEESGVAVIRLSSHEVSDDSFAETSDRSQNRRQNVAAAVHRERPVVGRLFRWIASQQFIHSIYYLLFTRRNEVKRIRSALIAHKPDLIHSLRIPYESVTVLHAKVDVPWVVSTWGSDFEPQAASCPILRSWTAKVVSAATAMTYDSPPDLKRAYQYGLDSSAEVIFAPGNLGLCEDLFYVPKEKKGLIVYPRKMSAFVNYWGFVEMAARLITKTEATFVGIGLQPIRKEILQKYPVLNTHRFITTEQLGQEEYASYIRDAILIVSPSYSDGMPNSILEALASGAHVVAGDLPQLRVGISNWGPELRLVDPRNVNQIASAVSELLSTQVGDTRVPEKYLRKTNITRIETFYRHLESQKATEIDHPSLIGKLDPNEPRC